MTVQATMNTELSTLVSCTPRRCTHSIHDEGGGGGGSDIFGGVENLHSWNFLVKRSVKDETTTATMILNVRRK